MQYKGNVLTVAFNITLTLLQSIVITHKDREVEVLVHTVKQSCSHQNTSRTVKFKLK